MILSFEQSIQWDQISFSSNIENHKVLIPIHVNAWRQEFESTDRRRIFSSEEAQCDLLIASRPDL